MVQAIELSIALRYPGLLTLWLFNILAIPKLPLLLMLLVFYCLSASSLPVNARSFFPVCGFAKTALEPLNAE